MEEASADFLSKPGHRSGPAARSPWGSARAPCLEGVHAASAHRSKWGGPAQLSLSALPVFLISHSLACCSCLEFLLDNGADPSLRDKQGYTAVHYAAAYGNRQNLELVSKRENPLCWQEMGEVSLRRDSSSPAASSRVLQAAQCQCLSRKKGNGFNEKPQGLVGSLCAGNSAEERPGPERKEPCYLARGTCGCLAPWQHSKAGLLKENLEACAKEELSQYRKSLVTLKFTAMRI